MLVALIAFAAPAIHAQEAEAPEPPAEAVEDGEAVDEAGGAEEGGVPGAEQMTPEQQELVNKFLEVLKDSMVLMVGWGSAALLAFLIPLPWIVIAFKNEKGWGVILLIVYALGCVFPWTGLPVLVYGFKHRLEYKKMFLLTVLIYAGFYGGSGYVSYRMQEIAGEMESLAVDAENLERDQEEAEAGAKETESDAKEQEASSALGGIMDKVKAVADKAGDRSASADEAMKETSAKPEETAKADAPAESNKVETEAAETTSKPAAPGEGGYAPAPKEFRVISLIGTDKRRTAMIAGSDGKNHLVGKGYKVTLGDKDIEVIDITADAVIIKMAGRATPMAIRAPDPEK